LRPRARDRPRESRAGPPPAPARTRRCRSPAGARPRTRARAGLRTPRAVRSRSRDGPGRVPPRLLGRRSRVVTRLRAGLPVVGPYNPAMGRQWLQKKRGINAEKRAKMTSKLAREIVVAAKMGAPDPAFNPRLALA